MNKQMQPVVKTAQGLYGERGWTARAGIADLLSRYAVLDGYMPVCVGAANVPFQDNFLRFSDLTATGAKKLWEVVAVANLADRQNSGPTLLSLLSLAARFPERVLLGGYLVGPKRIDERVSIDSIRLIDPPSSSPWRGLIRAESWADGSSTCNASAQLFLQLAQSIGLTGWLTPPDEFIAEVDKKGQFSWWIWWD